MSDGVSVEYVAHRLQLKNFTPRINLEERMVTLMDLNRPAIQLYGFYEHFESSRIQLIGNVEQAYLETVSVEERAKKFEELFSYEDIPCIIFSWDYQPDSHTLKAAMEKGIPLLGTFKSTTLLTLELINLLSYALAPQITIHGVLTDLYGVGVLIVGESGIGKSEAALELIRRGHRLVSDDSVTIRRISYKTLVGSSPDITRNFIELRGVGIIDVRSLFGVECVKLTQDIDLVIKLSEWNNQKQYDRLGMTDNYYEILGVKLVCNEIPIRPGRNLAVICETAAVNYRQKLMGYNAAEELDRRVRNQFINQ